MRTLVLALAATGLMIPAAVAGPFSPRPGLALDTAFALIQGRSCTACRRDCARQRDYCYGSGCQPEFVACMRFCWEEFCRR